MMLGKLLRRHREERGLSLRDVARATGFSYARLCEIENERGTNPRVSTLDTLATFYGIDHDMIFRSAVASVRKRHPTRGARTW